MQIQGLLPADGVLPAKPSRLESIDLLRGIVIVLMALDHTRDFFGTSTWGGPENVHIASPFLFFTRWATHFCAPTFVLLAGIGAFLSHRKGQPKEQLAGFLCLRGVLLILLELTVVKFGWFWNWPLEGITMLQVIWAIGWSMILLSFLVWLPSWFVGLLGLTIIFGHNMFDGLTGTKLLQKNLGWAEYLGVKAEWSDFFGDRGWLWDLLMVSNRAFAPSKGVFFNVYPIIPWFGVLAAGYGLGPLFRWEPKERRKLLFFLGAVTTVLFLMVRYQNGYGDPKPWKVIEKQKVMEEMRTFMSFLNCEKYPPSLAYLLMTLGPALLALAFFDLLLEQLRRVGPANQPESTIARIAKAPLRLISWFFLVFGRVPLFFYLIHLPVIHKLAKLTAEHLGQKPGFMSPLSKGFDLPMMYAIWAGIVLLLFLPCLGYGWLKRRYGGVLKLI